MALAPNLYPYPQPVIVVDATTGLAGTSGPTYTLASNQTLAPGASTTPVTGIKGGGYGWAYQFAGTSPQLVLEALGPDGVKYLPPTATVTAPGQQGITIGENATVRLRNTGTNPITGLYSNLT